jgi:cytoskeleton protein RodZ
MPEGFGARLRKQREERQIDLGWIAEQTKIKRSLLEALERDDVSHWPSGIFRRAYVRTYAHIIGLEPNAVLREFLQVHPEPVDMLEAAEAAAFEEAARRSAAPGMRLRTIVDSAIGSLARLRRPGAIDGSMPVRPASTAPARAVVAPPAVAWHDSAATVEDTAGGEELADVPLPRGPAPSLSDVPQPLLDEPTADATNETGVDVSASDPPPVAPDPILEPADDARAQAGASTPDMDPWVDTASDEHRVTTDSRLEAVANLCTAFGRARGREEILTLLEDSARTLEATGLIVWLWDESSDALWPVLVHGYSEQVVAHLPVVGRDADNATAEAFRSGSACEVAASERATGALVIPLLIPEGCAGVLAVELQAGVQAPGSVRALATVLAAALAQFVHRSRPIPGRRTRMAFRPSGSIPLE